jgi:hypothetical protein
VDLDARWRPGAQVISETLDGETVIINLATGRYYSLDALASWVWTALADGGATLREAALQAARAWRRDAAEVEGLLAPFLAALDGEGLLVAGTGSELRPLPPFDAATSAFAEPRMQRFDDIQELLLLDPIHEVEEAGWPAQRPQGQG